MILLNPGFIETAYLDNLNSASTILNSPIGHNGIVEEPSTLKDDIASIFEVGFSHDGTTETSISKIRSTQISTSQISAPKYSILQNGTTQIATTQISSIKVSLPQVGSTQVSPTQVSSFKSEVGQIQSTQLSSAQINFGTVDKTSQAGTCEVNSTQIKTAQSPATWSPYELDSGKISLPSSVKSQQLFYCDALQFHTLTPESISTFNSTNAQTLWNTVLAPQTPFDINLQFTSSLAKGQHINVYHLNKDH